MRYQTLYLFMLQTLVILIMASPAGYLSQLVLKTHKMTLKGKNLTSKDTRNESKMLYTGGKIHLLEISCKNVQ